MKLAILGAGAMGCLMGGLAARAGHDITFIARGNTLEALRRHGLTLRTTNDVWQGAVRAVESGAEAGPMDAVVIATKANQIEAVLAHLPPMLHAETMIVPAINGIPWWYFQRHGEPFSGRSLQSLDPTGALRAAIDPARLIGCVNYLAGSMVAPGEVQYVPELQRRLVFGELDGALTPRLNALAQVFADAGFAPVQSEQIRQVIWHKLWGNIAFNPIGALTGGTIDQIAEGYRDLDLVMSVMHEARFIADKLGIELNQTTKSRVEAAAKMRGHKTSMLQDMESGRPTEIEAIVGAVREIGKWMEADTPYLNSLYSLVKLRELFREKP